MNEADQIGSAESRELLLLVGASGISHRIPEGSGVYLFISCTEAQLRERGNDQAAPGLCPEPQPAAQGCLSFGLQWKPKARGQKSLSRGPARWQRPVRAVGSWLLRPALPQSSARPLPCSSALAGTIKTPLNPCTSRQDVHRVQEGSEKFFQHSLNPQPAEAGDAKAR